MLALTRDGEVWAATSDPQYEGLNSIAGSWTAAVALSAVERDAAAAAEAGVDRVPTTMTINFISPIAPGRSVAIQTRRLGGGRLVSHWSADVFDADTGNTFARIAVVVGRRRQSDGHLHVVMPDVPRPEELPEWHPPGAMGALVDYRCVRGNPPFRCLDLQSVEWVRETSGRRVDRPQLALLADVCAPRPFFWRDGPRPSASLALTIYFLATDDELAAVGDDYVLNDATGARGHASIADQSLRTWSRHGALLTTSTQLFSYRSV